jgi:hypothetical protein
VLKVADNLVENVLHVTPQEKNPVGLNLATWVAKRLVKSADLSPSHLSVQVIPNMVAEV